MAGRAIRCQFEGSDDVGVFACLTNSYCLVASGGSENFFSVFEGELADHIPVVHASLAGVRIIGRLCAGNKNGLLVTQTATDQELQHLADSLPDTVKVTRCDDRLTALGNVIACNDHIALLHPTIARETEEVVGDVLGVETIKYSISGEPLVGTFVKFTNLGGIVHPNTSIEDLEELSSLLQVQLVAGTLNTGKPAVGASMVANDWSAFCGMQTTATELNVLETVLKLSGGASNGIASELRTSLLDNLTS